MEFFFVCPKLKLAFVSADFQITENLGVIKDSSGQKTLDAKVELNEPCPFCGEKHVYHATELPCPFGIPKRRGGTKKENR